MSLELPVCPPIWFNGGRTMAEAAGMGRSGSETILAAAGEIPVTVAAGMFSSGSRWLATGEVAPEGGGMTALTLANSSAGFTYPG